MISQSVKTVLAGIFLWSTTSYGAPTHMLFNYSDLLQALKQGTEVKAVIDVNKCSTSSAKYKAKFDIFWSMNFANFWKFTFPTQGTTKEGVATSVNILTHQADGLAYNYVRLRIFADGSAEAISEFINPMTFMISSTDTFNCRISNGKDSNGIKLYALL